MITVVPPASCTACHGPVNSTCSMPSFATRNAIFLPLSGLLLAMLMVYPSEPGATPENTVSLDQSDADARSAREATRFPVSGSAGSHNPSGGGADFGTWC